MHVVHVETGRHFYGGAQQVIWLMQGLETRGVDNTLVCLPDAAIYRVASDAGLDVRPLPCAGDLDLRFVFRLRQLLGDLSPDLVHCHSRRGADFLGRQAARMAGLPAVVSRRVDNPESRIVAALRYRGFARVIAISHHIASLLQENGLDPARITVIRDAVDVDRFPAQPSCDAFRREFGIGTSTFTIAVVAQLIERKGHRYLLDALAHLERLQELRVLIFGTGAEEERLRAQVREQILDSVVTMAGFRPDVDVFLGCVDLLVHPALREGMGVAMLKAAAAGVPVVAFDTAGAKEAVADDVTGLLVPPANTRALAAAIDALRRDPERRAAMGEAARQRMRDEFAVRSMVEKHIEVYRQVAGD